VAGDEREEAEGGWKVGGRQEERSGRLRALQAQRGKWARMVARRPRGGVTATTPPEPPMQG